MNRILETCLVALAAATIPVVVFAQSGIVPLQGGVSVQQPVANNAVRCRTRTYKAPLSWR